MTYKEYLKAVEELHTNIIEACKKYPLGALICETIKEHKRTIEIQLSVFDENQFEKPLQKNN